MNLDDDAHIHSEWYELKRDEEARTTAFYVESSGSRTPSRVASSKEAPDLNTTRYVVKDLLEQGGMGLVFRARDTQLERDVAVKVLRPDRTHSLEAARDLTNEARIMGYLSHPGVAPIYERGICRDGRPYHVMKLVQGVTLTELIQGGETSPNHLLSVFADVCQTMAYVHARAVIHLDLKPANVMVGPFGEVLVMDWGLAQLTLPESTVNTSEDACAGDDPSNKRILGTPEYMSPEQARGRALDTRADVFALGATLCEILCGQPPYQEDTLGKVLRRAMRTEMHRTLERLDNCGGDVAMIRLAKQCLRRRKSQRPFDAIEMAQEMTTYRESTIQQVQSDMDRFFDLSLDMFCIADFNGYFRRINANFCRVLKHSEEDLLTRPFMEFVHPDDRQKTIDVMGALNQGQPVVRFQNRYRTHEGDYLTLEWTAKAVEEEGIIFAVARDVTAQMSIAMGSTG